MEPIARNLTGKSVVVALSGGVDSAVAASLLQQQGAIVQALHMTNWEDDDGYCAAATDLQDARKICEKLKLPLHHVNFSRQYRDLVFEDFLQEYRAGRTPNPDVLCNREIKFGVLRQYAKRLGGQFLATGHYARLRESNSQIQLLKAADATKDQSYFLHAVESEALANTVFPLGELDKTEVRRLARDLALPVYDKKDSTGICFIGERPFREFLARYLPANPGPIITTDGRTIGEHSGLMYYTLGQRQGLGVGGRSDSKGQPWYVADKNLSTNELTVVQGEHSSLYSGGLVAKNSHWIGSDSPTNNDTRSFRCKVKVRYRQADQDCRVEEASNGDLKVTFAEAQRAVAPGQFAVFYEQNRCLGGALIDTLIPAQSALRKTG